MSSDYFNKAGFGMATPKSDVHQERLDAARWFVDSIDTKFSQIFSEKSKQISLLQGLYSRIYREDQQDWFIVAGQLGFPSRNEAKMVGSYLSSLNKAVKKGNEVESEKFSNLIKSSVALNSMRFFIGDLDMPETCEGYLYVLSTRENPRDLKVGMTSRSASDRTKEINRATGVLRAFGVRGCWPVSNPTMAEKAAHYALDKFRQRADRELFVLDFEHASMILEAELIRTKLFVDFLNRSG